MKLDLQSIKSLEYKKLIRQGLRYYKSHNLTFIVVLAGLLVGFSLLKVNSLNGTIDSPAELTEEEALEVEPLVLTRLTIDEETAAILELLANDENVSVDSNLPDNRNNPFDDNSSSQLQVPDESNTESNDNQTEATDE